MLSITQNSPQAPPPQPMDAPPLMAATVFALDDPNTWLSYPAFEPPCSPEEVAAVQGEIDSIIGTTRGNKSIAKLVWNGDVRYWKQCHDTWESTPPHRPIGDPVKHPIVLYKSVYDDNDSFVRDAFPPRWLILTRLEIEQYGPTWASDSTFSHPDIKGARVQMLPSEIPAEFHVWFMTIAVHGFGCCMKAAREDHTCFGRYAHPRACLETLRDTRKGMEASGIPESHPFDSPDQLTRRERERGINDYREQAMKKFLHDRKRAVEMLPLAAAGPGTLATSAGVKQLQERVTEQSKRDADIFEAELKKRSIK